MSLFSANSTPLIENCPIGFQAKQKTILRKKNLKMLGNCFKILRTTSNSSNLLVARNYAFKSELKIKWNRPEKISCIKPEKSGDLKKLENVDQSRYMLGFEKSEELKE